jgi:hypothetical protein
MKHTIKIGEEETEELSQIYFFKPMEIVTCTKQPFTRCLVLLQNVVS